MGIVKGSEPWAMHAEDAALRAGHMYMGPAARSELAMRNTIEAFCRERWPDARVCHEMVIREGKTRADVVAVALNHLVAFEVKGDYDNTTRLLHQVAYFQLAVPEVWIVVTERNSDDARLIRHLIPSLGLIVIEGAGQDAICSGRPLDPKLTVEAEPSGFAPVPRCTLEILWRDELASVCERHRVSVGSRATRKTMIAELERALSRAERMAAVCCELRRRDALWRADPPMGATE